MRDENRYCDSSFLPSFREAISRAEEQIEWFVIKQRRDHDEELYHDICKIIAEVYMMRPDDRIRISGEWLDVRIVQEVFRSVDNFAAEIAVMSYKRQTERIKNPKAYLRTVVYNAAFSANAAIDNAVRADRVILI